MKLPAHASHKQTRRSLPRALPENPSPHTQLSHWKQHCSLNSPRAEDRIVPLSLNTGNRGTENKFHAPHSCPESAALPLKCPLAEGRILPNTPVPALFVKIKTWRTDTSASPRLKHPYPAESSPVSTPRARGRPRAHGRGLCPTRNWGTTLGPPRHSSCT